MRRAGGLAAACLAMGLAGAQAQDLPRSGSCVQEAEFGLNPRLEWDGETASIVMYGSPVPARIVGLRPHDDGFKLSALFEDPVTGEAEMILFSLPERTPTAYYMGVVRYDRLEDGTRVVGSMTGFEPAACDLTAGEAVERRPRRAGSSASR